MADRLRRRLDVLDAAKTQGARNEKELITHSLGVKNKWDF